MDIKQDHAHFMKFVKCADTEKFFRSISVFLNAPTKTSMGYISRDWDEHFKPWAIHY